jgi:CHASE1-domain containing sensor protein
MIDKAKVFAFALKHWKEILVVISLSLVTLKTRIDYNAIVKAYETSQQEMELQISSLRDIHAEELRQREESLQSYRDTIESIQQSYLESQADLEEERQNNTTEYVRQFSQDKEALSSEIIDAYGFQLVE